MQAELEQQLRAASCSRGGVGERKGDRERGRQADTEPVLGS